MCMYGRPSFISAVLYCIHAYPTQDEVLFNVSVLPFVSLSGRSHSTPSQITAKAAYKAGPRLSPVMTG